MKILRVWCCGMETTFSGRHSWPESVEFETPWGEELIELDRVVSITRGRSVQLVPSGDKSPRWVLQKLK